MPDQLPVAHQRTRNPAYAELHHGKTSERVNVRDDTRASAHNFRVGDMVTILFTDSSAYGGERWSRRFRQHNVLVNAHSGAETLPRKPLRE